MSRYSFVIQLFFYLKVSRPGLWFQTVWLYTLPTAQNPAVFDAAFFWVGLFFVCLPVNLLAYGLNDLADYDIDKHNIRKDSFLFGARGTLLQLKRIPCIISIMMLPFFIYFTYHFGLYMLLLLVSMVLVNIVYNLPKHGLRNKPPFELINQLGYLLILPFSIMINNTAHIHWLAIVYLILFCTHSHLMGEIMDVYPDKKSGRKTSATQFGIIPTKLIVALLVFIESALLFFIFKDILLSSLLLLGTLWLLLDALFIYKDRQYTRIEFTLFGFALNAIGISTMIWVWIQNPLAYIA